jgi:site-specific recombinase XerD
LSNSREYFNFINSISSERTKQAYKQNLTRFIKFCKLDSVDELLKIDMQKTIIDYVVTLRKDNISHSTIHVLLAPIYHFCEMSDIVINKKKIGKYKGERMRVVKDRCYTYEEISRLLNTADIRMKPIILLMTSSGVRVGSIPSLRLKHLQRIKDDIYRITVYENTNDEYLTFCSPECSKAVDDYLEYRTRNGEILTPESFLIRKRFDINDLEQVKKSCECIKEATLSALLQTY